MSEVERVHVGEYLVVGSGAEWRVMEQFGSFRMLKKVFSSRRAAESRARALAGRGPR